MTWMVPSIIATMAGTALLSLVYFYLYFMDRQRCLLIWAIGWATYLARYVFMLFIVAGGSHPFYLIANQLAVLISAVLLACGTQLFLARKIPSQWFILSGCGAVWIIVSIVSGFSFLVITLPTFLLFAWIYIWTGVSLLRSDIAAGLEKSITGWAFILWGIHKADYPFLRSVEWLAPSGYLLAAFLEFTVAIGILLIYFRKIRHDLIRERDLLEQLMETSPAGITRCDARGRIDYANRRAEQILGLAKDTISQRLYNDPGWKIGDLDGDPYPEERLPFSIVKETGRPVYDVSHTITWPSGERTLLSINAAPLYTQAGKFDGMVATLEDITEKHRVEKDYKMLFNAMVEGFALHEIICDDNGTPCDYRFIAVNPAFERLTTLRAEEIVGKTVLEVMPATELSWIKRYGDVALTGEPVEFEEYSRELDKFFQVTAFSPAANQFACIFSDITTRKRSEAALQSSHEMFMTVLEGMDASVYVADMRTNEILFMNKTMIDSFGGDMTGEKCWRVFRGESGQCPHCNNSQLVDENGRPKGVIVWESENPVTKRWYINNDRAIRWIDGRMAKIQIATDITDTKEMESRLQQAQKMESIGILAGGIAHDFNNILSPILGISEFLIEDLPPGSLHQKNARQIYRAGERAAALVKQILAFGRRSEEEKIAVGFQLIVKEALKLLRATIPSDIVIDQYVQSDCRLIMANPAQLHQIVMNLVTNAYHAVEDSGGTIRVELREVELAESEVTGAEIEAGRYLLFQCADSGGGIAPDVIGRVFDPYFTTKKDGKGTGLGLSVVYGVVKEYRGDIRIESELGKGTVVQVRLPVADDLTTGFRATDVSDIPTGSGHIFLVDDEEVVLQLERQLLERLGYQVSSFVDSVKALEVFRENWKSYDLVITDMTMPNMRGDALISEIRAIIPDMPVVICTGFSERLQGETAESLGIDGLLYKPLARADLAQLTHKILTSRRVATRESL